MIGAGVLTLFAIAGAGQVEPLVTLLPRDATSAEQAIGQPMVWRVVVDDPEHAGGALVAPPTFDLEWALVDGPRSLSASDLPSGFAPSTGTGEPADFAAEWTILPLEGGTVSSPALTYVFADGFEVAVPSVTFEVPHGLLEEEDAHRPLPGFRDVSDSGVGDARIALLALIGLILLPFAIFGFARLRKRSTKGAAQVAETAPLEIIRSLDAKGDPVGTMARLGPLLRRALEERLGETQPAATDEEWAHWVESTGGAESAEVRTGAAALLRALTEVRFGGGDPTRFAAEEASARAIEYVTSDVWVGVGAEPSQAKTEAPA